jgi:mono/diheme cytochrome c family protein
MWNVGPAVVAAAVIVTLTVLQAQQSPQGTAAPSNPPAKPIVPVAASTLIATPDPYIGESISLAAVVDRTLSRTVFSVDQDRTRSAGRDVLVVAPTLQRGVELNTYVTVIGEVVRFDPEALGLRLKEYKLDLQPEVASPYIGKPAVIATSVIDPAGNDLARRLPPPMTADEEAYQKLMKQVGSSNGALRKAIEGSDTKLAAEHGGVLRKTFVEVEAFWRGRRRDDARQWAQDARKASEDVERSAAAGRWDAVKGHAATLGKACQACHGVYRERFDDGSFRIKKDPRQDRSQTP